MGLTRVHTTRTLRIRDSGPPLRAGSGWSAGGDIACLTKVHSHAVVPVAPDGVPGAAALRIGGTQRAQRHAQPAWLSPTSEPPPLRTFGRLPSVGAIHHNLGRTDPHLGAVAQLACKAQVPA